MHGAFEIGVVLRLQDAAAKNEEEEGFFQSKFVTIHLQRYKKFDINKTLLKTLKHMTKVGRDYSLRS